jgi:endonuclease III
MKTKDKEEKLFEQILDFVSSSEESESFLREEGLDPDALVNMGIRRAKLIQMRLASQKTEQQYQDLKENLLQKVKAHVEKLLNDASFNLENFIKQENINLAFKNFEKLTPEEIREFLERHYLLKLESESKK